MKRLFLAAASIAVSAVFSVGQAQTTDLGNPPGVYTQAPSGMAYPRAVGDFQRVALTRYKSDGTDESAGYNRYGAQKEIVATVYVFPSPRVRSFGSPRSVIEDARSKLCQGQFKDIQSEIMGAHPDAVLLEDHAASLAQRGARHHGHFAAYKLTNRKFMGRENVLLRSDVYVFCHAGGKWTVEYRIDYPFDYDAGPTIAAFMQGLTWTIPPEPN